MAAKKIEFELCPGRNIGTDHPCFIIGKSKTREEREREREKRGKGAKEKRMGKHFCSDFRNESNGRFVLGVGFFLRTNFDFLTSHF